MAYRYVVLLFLIGLIALGGLTAHLAGAETLTQSTVDTRIALAYRVAQTDLQNWLPAPWQVNAPTTGPSKDANLNVTFVDRLLNQDAEGRPGAGPTYRVVAFSIPAKHSQTGESGPVIIRIFNSNPNEVPGFYKVAVPATIQREQMLKGVSLEPGLGSESWEVRDTAGGKIELRVQYQRGVPSRAKVEARPRSGADLSVWRIYRIDQGVDVVKSVPASIDRVANYQFRVTVPELEKLFGGSEQLVSVSVLPWYQRQTFLP